MLIRLTYQGKGTPTLVNLQNVKNIYPVLDKRNNQVVTKIEYMDGTYVNVEESVKEIFEIQWLMMNGSCNMDWETPSVDTMIETSFNHYTERPKRNSFHKRGFREHNYEKNY
jgi:hypothetical protein